VCCLGWVHDEPSHDGKVKPVLQSPAMAQMVSRETKKAGDGDSALHKEPEEVA
jgi:hypothetical protein